MNGSEKTIDDLKRKYKRIIENIPESIYSIDKNRRLSFISENIEDLTGYSVDELKKEQTLWKELLGFDHIKHILDQKEDIESVFPFEYKIQDKDGDTKYILNKCQINKCRSDGEDLISCEGLLIDITKRKELENKISDSEEKYRNLVETSLDGIALYKNKKLIYINQAGLNLFGYNNLNEIKNKDFDELFLGEQCKYLHNIIGDKDENNTELDTFHCKTKARKSDGTRFYVELMAHPANYFGDAVIQLSFRDITKIVEAEEEKERTERMMVQAGKLSAIAELASGVAHEINNPLSGISLHAEILMDDLEDDPRAQKALDRILFLTDRINKIVKEMHRFASPSEAAFETERVENILNSSLSLMQNRLNKNNIRIHQKIDSPLPEINARVQDLQQVFVNIINNARYALNKKYIESDPNKVITIRGKTTEFHGKDYIQVSFRDEGEGIAEEQLERVFDPFFSTQKPNEAIGLGLTVCQKIIQEHNGEILIDSNEGEYTTVTLRIPFAPDDDIKKNSQPE